MPTRVAEILLDRKAREPGLKDAEIARRAGINPQTLCKLKKGTRPMQPHWATLVGAALQLPKEQFYMKIGEPIPPPAPSVASHSIARKSLFEREKHAITSSLPDFPSYVRDVPLVTARASRGDATVDFTLQEANTTEVEYAARPVALAGKRQIGAIEMPTSVMEPWHEAGDVVYFHETRPISAGCHVLIFLRLDDGPPAGIVRKLVSIDQKQAVLRQYNPPKEETLDLADVQEMYRIYEWREIYSGMTA